MKRRGMDDVVDRGCAAIVWMGLLLCACTPAGADDAGDESSTDAPTTGEPAACGDADRSEIAISGAVADAHLSLAESAGDVNGDGVADLIIGAPGGWTDDETFVGSTMHVVLGPLESAPAILTDAPGFRILGEHAQQALGGAQGIGDVNGDGRSDVLVSATQSCYFDEDDLGCDTDSECPPPTCTAGPFRAYVVFGPTEATDVSLADVATGQGGFAIDGEATDDLQRQMATSLGDLDGDGKADFALAAPLAAGQRGALWVVFGKDDGAPVQLANIAEGVGGYAIDAPDDDYAFPDSIAGTGDVDGDGLGDLVVGATEVDEGKGIAYVVFGKGTTEPVDLADVVAGNGGFSIHPEPDYLTPWCCTEFARDVAGPGDVDGDGLADIAVGAPHLGFGPGVPAGRAYVVFGKADGAAVDLVAVGAGRGGGFAIDGQSDTGSWLYAGGDRTGDGLADLVVAGYDAAPYLVHGKADAAAVRLGDPGAPAIVPTTAGTWYPGPIVPDLDCDGRADLVLSNGLAGDASQGAVLLLLQ